MTGVKFLAVALILVAGPANAEATKKLDIDPGRITVSGISAGGAMAHQLHVAYPEIFSGAGIIAGPPFGCANGDLATAFARCMGQAPSELPVAEFAREIQTAATDGHVGDPAALTDDRVWLFHGANDTVVAPEVSEALAALYEEFLEPGNIVYVGDFPVAHNFPTADQGHACDASEAPFLGACDYDAAGEMLQHLYPHVTAPAGETLTSPVAVELAGAADALLAETAWLYIPSDCADGANTCALHLALHGCAQSASQVGMAFIEQAGYLRWAEANGIVVAFPQAISSAGNPLACWDWWGYSGADYRWREGAQMQVLADWVKTLAGIPDMENDPFMWLEEVESDRALEWARAQNERSLPEIEALPTFKPLYERNLEIFNSDERIAYPAYRGAYLYNFWRDENQERGLWRRTTPEEYRKKKPEWETVLDLDALAEAEGENWVWKGASCLHPDDHLCILALSRGGADATVRREFDTRTRSFVEGGFFLPEAKSSLDWIDEDTVIVGTDFDEPDALTDSGYPNIVKIWKRGTPLEAAKTVFKGETSDVASTGLRVWDGETAYDVVVRAPSIFTSVNYLLRDDELLRIDVPEDADIQDIHKGQLLIELKSDWDVGGNSYAQGSLLSIDLETFLDGGRDFQVVFEPTQRRALSGVRTTRNYVLVVSLDMVKNRVQRFALEDGVWVEQPLELPSEGALAIGSTSDLHDDFFYQYEDFLTPDSLFLAEDGGTRTGLVRQLPEFFDSTGITVEQNQAKSADGTLIPYFLLLPKGFEADGTTPTLLYGYGGFEVSYEPFYSATVGHSWVARGGAYVVANIRGGGEFGPAWHQAALRENRQKAYDDFIAVAEDLVARKVTSPEHLGIRGGSNGGLLVGNAFVQRPELFGAVVCQVPLHAALQQAAGRRELDGRVWQSGHR